MNNSVMDAYVVLVGNCCGIGIISSYMVTLIGCMKALIDECIVALMSSCVVVALMSGSVAALMDEYVLALIDFMCVDINK